MHPGSIHPNPPPFGRTLAESSLALSFLSKETLLRRAQHALAAVPREGHSRSRHTVVCTPGILTPILPWEHPQKPEPAQEAPCTHPGGQTASSPTRAALPAPSSSHLAGGSRSAPRSHSLSAWTQNHPLGSCAQGRANLLLEASWSNSPNEGHWWNPCHHCLRYTD